ncbi:MAG TPA: hypothetical protein VJA94_23410 [Candidatus Angelobacter sp.]
MNRSLRLLISALVCFTLIARAADDPALAQAFDHIKTLAGNWHGKDQQGKPVMAWFQVTSGGVTVLQMLTVTGWPEKPTLYHLDGDRLMATHYCSSGNQPRMVWRPAAGYSSGILKFAFLDSTNLKSPEAGHMTAVVFRWQDKDHFIQEWTWHQDGKDEVQHFQFERDVVL